MLPAIGKVFEYINEHFYSLRIECAAGLQKVEYRLARQGKFVF